MQLLEVVYKMGRDFRFCKVLENHFDAKLWRCFAPESLLFNVRIWGVYSTISVSLTVPGGCRSQGLAWIRACFVRGSYFTSSSGGDEFNLPTPHSKKS